MIKPEEKLLPVQVKYKDKIDLAHKLLNVYSVLVEPLTHRNICLLAICLLEDINSDDFQEIVIRSNVGITNEGQFRVELHRLKDKKLLEKDSIVNKKSLSKKLQKLADLINSGENVSLLFNFDIVH